MCKELFGREDSASVEQLSEKLASFYASCENYDAFHGPNNHPAFWAPIVKKIEKCVRDSGTCRVLEFGAGCSSFGTFLGDLRQKVTLDAQDVTDRNEKHLIEQVDNALFDDLMDINDEYDVIFSTFVWEHVTQPRETLDHLLKLLSPGGSLFLVSPRYDFPFYMSPSARHLSKLERFNIGFWLVWRRLKVMLGGQADFLIHLEPACLHVPYFRDADAVHWVSWWDLKRSIPDNIRLKGVNMPIEGPVGKFWIKYCILFVEMVKVG